MAVRAGPVVWGAVALDDGPARALVRRGKFACSGSAARVMAEVTAARAAAGLLGPAAADASFITWVPPAPWRREQRGCWLPERWGRQLAAVWGRDAGALLVRTRGGSQRGRSAQERRQPFTEAFRLRSGWRAPQLGVGARVLLLDDVRTTGTTLASAAQVLSAAGYSVTELAFTSVAAPVQARGCQPSVAAE